MWTVSLLWNLKWLFILDLFLLADCGYFVTTSKLKMSYIQNVTEKNHLVFALKSDKFSKLHLYNDTSNVGMIAISTGFNPKQVSLGIDCMFNYHTHTSDLVTPTEYSWLWIRWTGTQLEFGTGTIPGVDLVYSISFSKVVKYIGFGKSSGNEECYWIIGQTNELINESTFTKSQDIIRVFTGIVSRLSSDSGIVTGHSGLQVFVNEVNENKNFIGYGSKMIMKSITG
ncbi:hypothetical protein LOTGIDRAFT_168493 [Lottia gigantea]|uniref:Uncharacterized protein n=1 Tax=Lottia gigantea TaxID=225164 RepID=V3ZQ55_LOTGI|nr:hypothetical protein LOTGIDRAFT_168493 [Lottia gigantea]ESO84635.1 hypothetical protein LOTGIDRAFT_168493 [Lottia gigantea]